MDKIIFSSSDSLFGDKKISELKLPSEKIHIRIFQRNGRKRITFIENIPDNQNPKKILKAMRKEMNCTGNLANPKQKKEGVSYVIKLTGDQRENVILFLLKNKIVLNDKDIIKHGA